METRLKVPYHLQKHSIIRVRLCKEQKSMPNEKVIHKSEI